jgi:hypothetical protein
MIPGTSVQMETLSQPPPTDGKDAGEIERLREARAENLAAGACPCRGMSWLSTSSGYVYLMSVRVHPRPLTKGEDT